MWTHSGTWIGRVRMLLRPSGPSARRTTTVVFIYFMFILIFIFVCNCILLCSPGLLSGHILFLYELLLAACHGTDRMVDRSCPHICKFLCPILNHDD